MRFHTPKVDILSKQGNFANVVAVDPKNPDIVWAGGLDLWRSTDAGQTWSPTAGVTPPWLETCAPSIMVRR